MYNAELKERYIIEKEATAILPNNYLRCNFEKVSGFERSYDRDLCNWTKMEIMEFYKYLGTASVSTLVVMNSAFSQYSQWCNQNNLVKDHQNHFSEITAEMLHHCINIGLAKQLIIVRQQLITEIRSLPNPSDQFALLALFEGIKGKDFCEILNIKTKDISDGHIKLCTGRVVRISKELENIALESASTYDYYTLGDKGKVIPFIGDADSVIKDYPNVTEGTSDFIKGRRIYNKLNRAIDYLGLSSNITANALYESGRIWFIKQELEKYNMNLEEYLKSKNRKDMENQYNSIHSINSYILKYGSYFE